ncbi:hypothetical protein E4631_23355 [Hymenobacter sp. UV11]|uniref:hypothetical protein n=1 Tax=Hymenobacter sp. UV11 TaxID=1849735 RepID=UPI00105B7837|nr:hypothetical protein [Hymenobacter sp. UV11]TDN39834.1 hypothetical protein A8B98_16720 [Hymenobacter sp. UV11]TFZ63244.1 hypothetical protein E4631_23355 [Hymenobacter sp. UV11]
MKSALLLSFGLLVCAGCSEQKRKPEAQAQPAPSQAEVAQHNELIKEYEAVKAKQLGQANSSEYIEETLGKLSAQGLKSIQAGERVVYFSDPSVNKLFLEKLKARAGEWKKLHARQVRSQAVADKQDAAQQAVHDAASARQARQERVSYAKTIRNDFLDNNLDIKVSTSGQDATHLTLEYALFSAVWARKLQVGGGLAGHTLDEWHEKGFTKITLSDGYDYASSFTFH